ncbi:MAG: hypothetical protein SF029_02495 [bacterium]|nr:hypothetical protein [bacterium]
MKKGRYVITILTLLLCLQEYRLIAHDRIDLDIKLFGNRLWSLSTSTGQVSSIAGFTTLEQYDSPNNNLSPLRNHIIVWENYPQLFANGVVLSPLTGTEDEVIFPIDSPVSLHFSNTFWPLGERFALIQAGVVTGGDPQYPNPIWMLDTNAWLVDTVEKTFEPWYWNCDTLIVVEGSFDALNDQAEFAVECTAYLPPFSIETMFLTSQGIQLEVESSYHSLYTRTLRDEPGWFFTEDMARVAVVNRHNDTPLRDEVLTYGINRDTSWLATFDRQTQPVSRLFWSPTGHYLSIATGCFGLTIADCFQIRNADTGEVIWDTTGLAERLYGSRHLVVTSIYWFDNENEFLLLGHFANEDSGTYLWHISLEHHNPLARWEVPSSAYAIIDVGY